MDLTFGEQIKVILSREHMTIKTLAEQIEAHTGVPCSRQNLTQKLKRDNFQEQDMRKLAAILGYDVQITLIPTGEALPLPGSRPVPAKPEAPLPSGSNSKTEILPPDCINPLTQEEYLNNTVRSHPVLAQFIQVYDRAEHAWTDISEDYFLKFQEQKRQILGNDYVPPIYI